MKTMSHELGLSRAGAYKFLEEMKEEDFSPRLFKKRQPFLLYYSNTNKIKMKVRDRGRKDMAMNHRVNTFKTSHSTPQPALIGIASPVNHDWGQTVSPHHHI